jgi:hypothetical protein
MSQKPFFDGLMFGDAKTGALYGDIDQMIFNGINGIGPGESIKDYAQGSYELDPTPPASASIKGNSAIHNSLTLKGGPRGASFTVNKYLLDASGNQTSQSQATVKVEAGKTVSVGVGGNVPGMVAGGAQMFVIRLADTFYITPVTPTPPPPGTPNPNPPVDVGTPAPANLTLQQKITNIFTGQAIPRVPNYVPIILVTVAVVGGVGVAKHYKKI